MASLKTKFGLRLKIIRTDRGLTQEQLAELLDVTIDTISKMERGVHGPRFELLERIARALKTPVHAFFQF